MSAFGGDLKNPRASIIHLRRLWRSLKYEEVFLKAYDSVIEARRGIGGWLYFYNEERLHQALGYRTPRAVFAGEACEPVDNPPLRDALLRVIHMLRGTTSGEGGINVLTQVKHGLYWGGGSSINWMAWARGHKNDWDYFASEAGDPAWNYEGISRSDLRIEDWHCAPDPKYRGTGGPVFVEPAPNPNPIAPAMLDGARSVGIPTFENQNGRMMEGSGGASIIDLLARDGKRMSVFRAYVFPYMDRPNLTVLTHALVTRLTFDGKRATGVEITYDGKTHRIEAGIEVILSLGAIQTPKVLMQSGLGDQVELQRLGIPVVQHLPGVGQNFQDHPGIGCIWEYQKPLAPRNNAGEATFFWKSNPSLDTPDIQNCQVEVPLTSAEMLTRFNPPAGSWTMFGGLVRPKSRGRIRLTGPNPRDPLQIEPHHLSHADDLKAAIACVQLCREIGNSDALRPFTKREVMPGNLKGAALENFIRDSVVTYHHQTCTAKMGRDAMSVVDGNLKVYGVDNLRIADGSIMPRVTTGNTMAPCVVIGERGAEILKATHRL